MPDLDPVDQYWRAANYLSVAQVYLQDNCLLEAPLRAEHVKHRLLGHWGTCPGINYFYAGLNGLIRATGDSVLLVTGPGHGAPANLANLWLEGSLGDTEPMYSRDRAGLFALVRGFSWPDHLASHLTPRLPGTIHEGGELGYALAKAFGAAFDNPDLVVACIVGDGEAETAATATAWHGNKFLNPARDGAVLPIVHVNGYKIANPTLFGTMTDDELTNLFTGLGWQPRLLTVPEHDHLSAHQQLADDLAWAHERIRTLQVDSRDEHRPVRPAWPMLVVRSPKGWTGLDTVDGVRITGSSRTHQVPVGDARTNPDHLALLEQWLHSYRPDELFDADGSPTPVILSTIPDGDRRLGANPHANGGELRQPLKLPALEDYAVAVEHPGSTEYSAMRATGSYLAGVFEANDAAHNFRIMCPDELASNRLDAVLSVTSRAYQWPVSPDDPDQSTDGRVLEVLSEHNCQGWLEGYLLTGRHGLFPCYEAFVGIIDGMANQHAKFLKVAREVPWRAPVSSLNYLLSSEGWSQEHNGYSHQGPGFINSMLDKKASVARIYLPPDANTLLAIMERCLTSTESVNVVVAAKKPLPQWLNLSDARTHCRAGISEWRWASSATDCDVDAVIACAGAIPTIEALAAADLLRHDLPDLAFRVVNVVDLLSLQHPDDHHHGVSESEFLELFGANTPVLFNFHGYPSAIHELVHHRPEPERFHVHGYIEEGTTTTPFDLLMANRASRYHLAIGVLQRISHRASAAGRLIEEYTARLGHHWHHARDHGEDPPGITGWTWKQ
jgi:xylulose-5-phosphate/fructose-6-phosphate phosphoketolase